MSPNKFENLIFTVKTSCLALKRKNSPKRITVIRVSLYYDMCQCKLLTGVDNLDLIPNMTNQTDFGAWAENYVAQYLNTRSYEIIERNYRKKWGEIDIIARKDGILIFVEVKANKNNVAGFEPEQRVNREKLKRLNRAIQTYLAAKKYPREQDWQIDIVSLTLDKNRGVVKIKHFKNIEL